jgi:YegS/Rv2252/BmrU family lipid kinase
MAPGSGFRTFVVVNPASAAGRTRGRWPMIEAALRGALGSFEHAFTEGPQHAIELSRGALAEGYEMIVAVGGDGTCGEVLTGFYDPKPGTVASAVIGILPQGTGCDFPRTLGWSGDLQQCCARLTGRATRPLDVGLVRFQDHRGADAVRLFMNVVSFGCGGAVAEAVARANKRLGARLAFTITTFKTLARYRDQEIEISIDGGSPSTRVVTNFAICNAQYFGGGMRVSPTAVIDDGHFDTTLWSGYGLLDLVRYRAKMYSGAHTALAGTTVGQARQVTATSRERVLLDVDGENPGTLPVEVRILPGALALKVP